MSDLHFNPGLSWNQFVTKYAKQSGLTRTQAMVEARSAYHEYKAAEAQIQKEKQAPKPKIQPDYQPYQTDSKAKSKKREAAFDPEYQKFLAYQKFHAKSDEYLKAPKKKPVKASKYKMIQVPVDSDSESDSD